MIYIPIQIVIFPSFVRRSSVPPGALLCQLVPGDALQVHSETCGDWREPSFVESMGSDVSIVQQDHPRCCGQRQILRKCHGCLDRKGFVWKFNNNPFFYRLEPGFSAFKVAHIDWGPNFQTNPSPFLDCFPLLVRWWYFEAPPKSLQTLGFFWDMAMALDPKSWPTRMPWFPRGPGTSSSTTVPVQLARCSSACSPCGTPWHRVVCTSFRTCTPTLGSTRSLQRTQAVNDDRDQGGAGSTACTFPKVVRACCFFYILTWKCASRHSGVHFFDISTSKSGPNVVCFVHFDLEMCRCCLSSKTICNFATRWYPDLRRTHDLQWISNLPSSYSWYGSLLQHAFYMPLHAFYMPPRRPLANQAWAVVQKIEEIQQVLMRHQLGARDLSVMPGDHSLISVEWGMNLVSWWSKWGDTLNSWVSKFYGYYYILYVLILVIFSLMLDDWGVHGCSSNLGKHPSRTLLDLSCALKWLASKHSCFWSNMSTFVAVYMLIATGTLTTSCHNTPAMFDDRKEGMRTCHDVSWFFHCFPKVKLRKCTELECASPPKWREVRVDMDRMVAWNERATATNPKARFFPKKNHVDWPFLGPGRWWFMGSIWKR